MGTQLTLDTLPQAVGPFFKPVDHVMVALAGHQGLHDAVSALEDAGFSDGDILQFDADPGEHEPLEMNDPCRELACFGAEATLMRRCRKLSAEGHRWLLVYAPEDEQAHRVVEVARRFHAPMAVKYHRLLVEDLI